MAKNQPIDLREVLGGLVSTEAVGTRVRPEIAASWRRSISADLRPDRFDVPYEPDSGDAGHPAVDVAIVGTRNADHVADAVAAADLVLSAAYRWRIDAVMTHAVPVGGPSPESMP